MSTLRRSSSSFGSYADGIVMRGMPLLTLYPGNVYWVDSGGGGSSVGSFSKPVSDIPEAMTLCTSGNGDIIVCKPGHVTYISAAADLVCDKSDVAILGTGSGSNQAKIVFDTVDTADIDVAAANVSFVNMWFHCNVANVDGAIDVAASGDYFTVQGCRVTDGSAALEFEEFINLATNADYFSFIGNYVSLYIDSGTESLVYTTGDSLGMRVMDNVIVMEASTSIFDIDAATLTVNPVFMNNVMVNLNDAADFCVEIAAASVGIFANERYACASGVVPVTDTTACFLINCHASEAADVGSLLMPETPTAW